MNIASLALVSALAAVVGCAQPAWAQTQDQTGATSPDNGITADQATTNGPNRGSATMGAGNGQSQGNYRGEDGDDSTAAGPGGNQNQDRRWSNRAPMMMGPMWRHRQMMMGGAGGARFRFVRGKARIDVRCSVQEDTQACVRAAGELLDKIAQLHRGGRDDTTGSAGKDDDRSTGPAPNDQQENRAAPSDPGERM